jgi:hypothetical protein
MHSPYSSNPEDGGSMFLQNVGEPLPGSTPSKNTVLFGVTIMRTSSPTFFFNAMKLWHRNCVTSLKVTG